MKVLSYFYEGMLFLVNADVYFAQRNYETALQNFEDANKLIVRSRASRGRKGDQIYNEMKKWESYTKGYIDIISGIQTEDVKKQLDFYEEAIKELNNFLEARKKEENKIDEIIAKARINFVEFLYYKSKAFLNIENSKAYKAFLLKARSELMKANFLFRNLAEEMEELQNFIDEITKQHIVAKAEGYWDTGTKNITISKFDDAQMLFAIASEYYSRASEICANFMEQRLYLALSKITLASRFESEANELYKREDDPKEASKQFQKAVETVDLALGLLTSIKSKTLIQNMRAQRSFYEALAFETEGIYFFDKEEFDKASEKFSIAIQKLDETQLSATEGNLEQLLEFVRTSKSEVEGYISMTNAMGS